MLFLKKIATLQPIFEKHNQPVLLLAKQTRAKHVDTEANSCGIKDSLLVDKNRESKRVQIMSGVRDAFLLRINTTTRPRVKSN